MDKKIVNVGLIFQVEEDNYRNLEDIVRKRVKRLIFVKKCPITVKLEIKENFPTRERDNDGNSTGETTIPR